MDKLTDLIQQGREGEFYRSRTWKRVAHEVRRLDRNECQLCKARGRYTRGVLVHHIKHLRDRPDLAMDIYDPITGERQLITVCKRCHEEQHAEEFKKKGKSYEYMNDERW
jgi:5-methylcytosine-specific restriction protein A